MNEIIEDIIGEIDADLEFQPRAFPPVFCAFKAAVNAVAVACRDAGPVDEVIAAQRTYDMSVGSTCEKAFGLFAENMLLAIAI
ncbi:hypothetical protein [Herbaspirillum sp. SJZ107]|uniref:hypothetical protein n=1 Tax=Herbaspirillum sp. SJZ107 TaxID=2572881 RepID=UPI001150088A|nr:hypothetical protein [Herbaspirillum sp. SJZ107]